jgi:hypothetical protein
MKFWNVDLMGLTGEKRQKSSTRGVPGSAGEWCNAAISARIATARETTTRGELAPDQV